MPEGLEAVVRPWIETFQSRACLDLRPLWQAPGAAGGWGSALRDPWGAQHRPDWQARGLVIWPRGGRWLRLRLTLPCPEAWRARPGVQARLALCWWADAVVLRVDGAVVHEGDLFDTACRWLLPARWWQGRPLELELELRSPRHDDGALIESRLELEPSDPADPEGVLLGTALELAALRQPAELAAALVPWDPADPPPAAQLARALAAGPLARPRPGAAAAAPTPGPDFHVLGHAHLDLAWLWPVADTWQAAERTFASALALMERHPQLHFAHSTPALYAWIEQHRPALFAAIRRAMQRGRWEPINGPWVETDCVLVATASLLRQFQEGQHYSRSRFPEWRHELCWLPDSFGFGAGLPAVARATGVRWFCTHKLAWNATNPFPHRLFRWRSRCGSELLALMTAPIGTGGDPVAMESYRQQWRRGSGVEQALWLPGVGDHGGGPTAEMLEQLELWQQQPLAGPQRHGSLRSYLEPLEPLAPQLPVWRDELYLELHRGCPTSRPDQKRHNRSLERLLREAEAARALLWLEAGDVSGAGDPVDWRPLLFQQFHDILPGTSIPEVFEQAEPQWRQARRQAGRQRDRALAAWLASRPHPAAVAAPPEALAPGAAATQPWWLVQLQPHPGEALCLRLPRGRWWLGDRELPVQPAPGGGSWVQLPAPVGLDAVPLRRSPAAGPPAGSPAAEPAAPGPAVHAPVQIVPLADGQGWRLDNGLVRAELGPTGVGQLWGADGLPQLAAPLEWRRWRDQGEFWDAWDIAADYRDHPLPLQWSGPPQLVEVGPLCVRAVWRGQCGRSALRLDVQLRAGSPWLDLTLAVDWRQRHELLRLELPLAQPAVRLAADGSGGVLERPADPATARERARWELPAISWVASQAEAGGLAVLLDGPQGVSGMAQRLGVSLLRGPTWPDPSADNGWQRLRLALMPCRGGWRQAGVARQAVRFREPLWRRPVDPAPQRSLAAAGTTSGVHAAAAPVLVPLHLGHADLQLLALRPDPRPGVVQLSVQNLGPCRQRLVLPAGWRFLERCDGLGEPLCASAIPAGDQALLAPWQLGFWRVAAAGTGS